MPEMISTNFVYAERGRFLVRRPIRSPQTTNPMPPMTMRSIRVIPIT